MNECPKKESKIDICPRRKEFSQCFSKGRWTSQTRARPWWTGSRWFNMGRKHLAATMRTKLRWFMDRMNQLSLGFSKQNIKRTSSTAALRKWRRQPQTPRREQSIGRDWIQSWEGLNAYVTGIRLLNLTPVVSDILSLKTDEAVEDGLGM